MARIRLGAVACLVVFLVGCSGNRFLATLPPVPGDFDVDSQPVELLDHTGLVTGLEAADPPATAEAWRGHVTPVAADPLAVRIDWGAGMCEARTRLTFEPTASAFVLRVEHDGELVFGCPAAMVFRSVILRLREPIEPSRIGVVVENG